MRYGDTAGPLGLVAVLSALAAGAAAQESGWESDQVNTTMCYWEQLRASALQDTLYMDGGSLWWLPGMSDGSYGSFTNDDNPTGIVYTLNFSKAFTTSDNITALMGTLSKVSEDSASNNIAPNYIDGAMLANDDEWFLYGGLLRRTDAYTPPASDAALAYQVDQYGVYKPSFRAGFVDETLPDNMTRYVAYGGAANAPSENKAWYFSGLRSPSWGPIYTVSSNDSLTAINVSDTLIMLDLGTQQSEVWHNTTLPANVSGRANPELVWVPVGSEGVLVAIGGVVYPDFVTDISVSEDEAANKQESPGFMTTVDVYDVANETWYQQPTSGDAPGQLTRGCAVLATASDYSSFNIYWYGGYDGLDSTGDFNDDVYVLSLPSFTWVKVSSGNTTHARAGHKCVKPYPDQMFVVGGYASLSGSTPSCLDGGIVQLFNLSSAEWMTSYSPEDWSNYTVPDAVVSAIGGNGQGSATATQPAATSGWADAALSSVFATAYETSKLTTYYPYPLAATTSTLPTLPATSTAKSSGSHVPTFLPPLLGVVCGLMFVTLVVLGFILYRRRGFLCGCGPGRGRGGNNSRRTSRGLSGAGAAGGAAGGAQTASDASTYDTRRNFISSWLRAMPSVKQSSSTGSPTSFDERNAAGAAALAAARDNSSPLSPEMTEQVPRTPSTYYGQHPRHPPAEVAGTCIAEMMADTAHPAELPGSTVMATEGSSGRWRSPSADDSEKTGGVSFPASSAELDSTTSPSPPAASNARPRPDSPPLGTSSAIILPSTAAAIAAAAAGRAPGAAASSTGPSTTPAPSSSSRARVSGVSDLSETDRRHLRQGSESSEASSSAVSAMAVSPTSPLCGSAGIGSLSAPVAATAAASAAVSRPQPIPEAEEDERTAETTRTHSHTTAPYRPTSAGRATPEERRSAFRESEEDMSG